MAASALRSPRFITLVALACMACCLNLSFVMAPPRAGQAMARNSKMQAFPAVQVQVGQDDSNEPTLGGMLRIAAAVCAALMLALVPLEGAEAARSGGRMGGSSSFRARAPPPRQAAPRSATAGPRVSTGPNISIGVAPSFGYGGFGYGGFGMPFGGLGFFGPPVLPIPVPSGPSMNDQMLQNQQLRDEAKLEAQKAEIQELQKQLATLKAARQ
eukprot:TRINITY_DN87834_c0_g1_i1.p1 TRINITY_DN87834_c0_g1~~TRINITY_DN87834_c0_g1_i1.p1  ORF type:complete len:235 (+),score=43.04 TRINITY_DN87834_c0_g1_i1:67-705(+)